MTRDVHIPRVNSRPKLEEFLDGRERTDMLRLSDFRQRSPGDGVPVSQPTVAYIGYDDKMFYAVFVSKRDDVFSDDIIGVFLDTYHDRQRAYEFFVNPLGVQGDAVAPEGANDDFSFDTLWYSDGRITADGYVASMAIPFRSLRFRPSDVQTWGFGAGRFIPTNNESSFYPYITRRESGFNQQLATASGIERISPGRNIQIIPYGALGHGHFLDQQGLPGTGPLYRTDTDVRVGFDAKMVLHDSLTLDVAVRPDFSQVESDDPQVTVNQRYEVQFAEKRPFFIENSSYFSTPEELFFSRRVIDPEYGGRLTGKLGRWNMGFLGINDRAPGIAAGPGDVNYGKKALIGVARIQREFGKQSNVGLLFTDREFAGGYNRVGALDTRLRLNRNWFFIGQAIGSSTTTPDGTHTTGTAFVARLQASHRNYFYNLNYRDRSPGFRTQMGFVPRVDIRQLNQFANYRFRPANHFGLISFGPTLFALYDTDHRGVQQDWTVRPGMQAEFSHSTYLGFSHGDRFERFAGFNFRLSDNATFGHSEYFRKATFDWSYQVGGRINYSTPTGMDPFVGQGTDASLNITFRPIARLKMDENYTLTRLRSGPEGVFVNHLVRSRSTYQFNRALSLRMILDYNATNYNPRLINLEKQKRVAGDVLLTWMLHPGTAFYLGYTNSLENLLLQAGNPNNLVRTNLPNATVSRQFFAKVSYLFRF